MKLNELFETQAAASEYMNNSYIDYGDFTKTIFHKYITKIQGEIMYLSLLVDKNKDINALSNVLAPYIQAIRDSLIKLNDISTRVSRLSESKENNQQVKRFVAELDDVLKTLVYMRDNLTRRIPAITKQNKTTIAKELLAIIESLISETETVMDYIENPSTKNNFIGSMLKKFGLA